MDQKWAIHKKWIQHRSTLRKVETGVQRGRLSSASRSTCYKFGRNPNSVKLQTRQTGCLSPVRRCIHPTCPNLCAAFAIKRNREYFEENGETNSLITWFSISSLMIDPPTNKTSSMIIRTYHKLRNSSRSCLLMRRLKWRWKKSLVS